MTTLDDRIEQATGSRPKGIRSLGGGCVGDVRLVELENGDRVVVKTGEPGCGLEVEGFMLGYLDAHELPVPEVHFADDTLLVMSYIETEGGLTEAVQRHAADLLADLHDRAAPRFGFERDTLIGGLPQPNPWTDRWVDFFRDQRLLAMARQGLEAGRLPGRLHGRLERFCGVLDRWIEEPEQPSLLHGDLWTGNVLCRGGRIAGFIDPAIYYGHAEIELAFSTLFGTFERPFFLRYQELRGVRPGFFEERLDIYNLYPLLVHVRLFGGGYIDAVDQILSHHGF